MSKIHDAVVELRRAPGIKGAMVLTADGLVAAQALDPQFGSDAVAGLTSYLLMTANRSLAEAGLPACSEFVLHATHGKAVFISLDESYLVVLLDQFADLSQTRQELRDAEQRIRRASRLA